MSIPVLPLLMMAAAAQSAGPVAPATPADAIATEHRGWIDDHARWNAQHMAAARRLEAVAAALRRHDTSFDRHGGELRDHRRGQASDGTAATKARHARLRAAHAEAARSHKRLMDEVADLERTIVADLAADRFEPR